MMMFVYKNDTKRYENEFKSSYLANNASNS